MQILQAPVQGEKISLESKAVFKPSPQSLAPVFFNIRGFCQVGDGLTALPTWNRLQTFASLLDNGIEEQIGAAVATAKQGIADAELMAERSKTDRKLQMKAIASAWHREHHDGAIVNCPLCDQDLNGCPELKIELEALKEASDLAESRCLIFAFLLPNRLKLPA